MNNNDIFKKLRVALQLRDEQIIEILQLVDFRISAAELGAFFRKQDHPNYMECGDQVLRNFLNGLVIHLRGTKEDPKNPMDVINENNKQIQSNAARFPKDANIKTMPSLKPKPAGAKTSGAKPFKKTNSKKPAPKIEIVEKVRYNNDKGKNK